MSRFLVLLPCLSLWGCATSVDDTSGHYAPGDARSETVGDSLGAPDVSVDDTSKSDARVDSTPLDDTTEPDDTSPPDDTSVPPPPDSGPPTTSFDGGFPDGFSSTSCTTDTDCAPPFNCCEKTFSKKCGFKSGSVCFPGP